MSLLAEAMAEATQDVAIEIAGKDPATGKTGVLSLGWHFRIRRLTSRELDVYRGYMLLMVSVPDEEKSALAKTIREAVESGDDLSASLGGFISGFLHLVRGQKTPEKSKKAEDMRAAILAAGVTHWSRDGQSWRPVRLLVDGEPSEGDGETKPDVITVRLLPGGGSTEEVLVEKILTMSQAGAAEARRLATFRSAA